MTKLRVLILGEFGVLSLCERIDSAHLRRLNSFIISRGLGLLSSHAIGILFLRRIRLSYLMRKLSLVRVYVALIIMVGFLT